VKKGVARGTQTKILGLRIHPKATDEVFIIVIAGN
jgi:hypothetical protein